ncbi:MAG: preprotein translocase subunit YajC [Deltaproteobacteria bacterium]|nr:preprotein translocase subunit YajC [Deltaproteobacteria bacterium]MBW2417668.1 preprotein translocase subunit YajC [Deltaproteobacteria bacterium]
MNAIPTAVTLQAAAAQGPDFSFFIMLAALGAIWFLLVLRPQQKRQKEHEATLKAAGKGDEVITSGGLHGRISAVKENIFVLEVGKVKGAPVHVEVEQARVERVVKPEEQKAAGEKAGGDKAGEAKPGKGGAGS